MSATDKFSEKYPEQNKFLEYEVFGSWWSGYIFTGWMQTLAGKYFAWKMLKKYNRYKKRTKERNHPLPNTHRPDPSPPVDRPDTHPYKPSQYCYHSGWGSD